MIRDPASTDLAAPGRVEQLPARWVALRGATLALSDARGEWTWRELEHGRKQLAEETASWERIATAVTRVLQQA